MTDTILAFHQSRVPRGPGRQLTRDSLSWLLVVLVHIIFMTVLIVSLRQERARFGHRGAVETILDFSNLHTTDAPPVNLIKPEVESNAPPDISAAPITITPPKPVPVPDQNGPAAPGDVLRSIGQALACGANNFEYLSPAQQDRCRHQPWQGRRLPNGAIVLDAPTRPLIPEEHVTGADALRHDMQTAPPCPVMMNGPCLDDIFTGRNSRAP